MRTTAVLAVALLAVGITVGPAWAQEPTPPSPPPPAPPPEKWSDTAEFSWVLTAGNSETNTLGFKDKLWRKWTSSAIEVNAGGIRTSTTTIDRFGVGTLTDFDSRENKQKDVTAESYYLNGRYDHNITADFFWMVGAGWDRNTFAGIQNRYTAFGGVGNVWVDEENIKFRTDYALTYTDQQDVVENPDVKSNFFGARFSWAYWQKITETTTYGNDFIVEENLDETSDFRLNMTNWLAVTINKDLALKVSLQWLFDNDPSLKEVDVFNAVDINGDPSGAPLGKGTVELEQLDTVFTASLVVNF